MRRPWSNSLTGIWFSSRVMSSIQLPAQPSLPACCETGHPVLRRTRDLAFLIPEGALRGCREGSESRLAEVDAGRKDRRRVYRVRDDEPGPSAAASRRRISSANVSPETDIFPEEDAEMGIVIGPVLRRADGSDSIPRLRPTGRPAAMLRLTEKIAII